MEKCNLTTLATMPRKPKRNDVPVKIDAEVLRVARIVAAYEDLPLAELISESLRPLLQRKLEAHQKHGKKTRDS